MLEMRPRNERGVTKLGWLNSSHTFSFADYYDPEHMGFGQLRAINDDILAPNKGFKSHFHKNMEIITLVSKGWLEYKDNLGNLSTISSGDVQRISAGTGIIHCEKNPSLSSSSRFLQIWILPNKTNFTPEYEKKTFKSENFLNKLCLIVSPDAKNGSLRIYQDVCIYQSYLQSEKFVHYHMRPSRKLWLQIIQGAVEANSLYLKQGDGLSISKEAGLLRIKGSEDKNIFVIIDLPSR